MIKGHRRSCIKIPRIRVEDPALTSNTDAKERLALGLCIKNKL